MNEADWLASEDPLVMLARVTKPGDSAYPQPQRATDRKLRLIACACCRAVPELMLDDQNRISVERGEAMADGAPPVPCTHPEFVASWAIRDMLIDLEPSRTMRFAAMRFAAMWCTGQDARSVAVHACEWLGKVLPLATMAGILRDILGNPFHPLPPEAISDAVWAVVTRDWFTDANVRTLAHAAYDHRLADGALDPFRLAILADALEDAGCDELLCERCEGTGVCALSRRLGVTTPVWGHECEACHGKPRSLNPLLQHLRSAGPHYCGCWAVDIVRSAGPHTPPPRGVRFLRS